MKLRPQLHPEAGVSRKQSPGDRPGRAGFAERRRICVLGSTGLGLILGALLFSPTGAEAESQTAVVSSTDSVEQTEAVPGSKENVAPADSTNRHLVPNQAGQSPRLVWTTMTTPNGHEVRVLRPEGPTLKAAAPDQGSPASPFGEGTPGRAGSRPATRPQSPDLSGIETYSGQTTPVPRIAAFGVYGGYPSALGLQTVIPTDAPLSFRMGLTGFPKVGWLWTPGLEVHFGQVRGRFNTNGIYHFSNLFIGQTSNGTDKDHWGAESGFGYRWLLPDRRGVRWVAAVEMGGRWTTESGLPDTPSLRAFWMIAAP